MEEEMQSPPSSPEGEENASFDYNIDMLENNRLIFEAINTIISDAVANAAEEQALAAAIDESLEAQAAYKETISEEGINQLKETTYNKELHQNDKCSITLENLSEWDGPVTQLPCNHVFLPDAIYEWLKEKPVCPICNYKMKSKEIKTQQTHQHTQQQAHQEARTIENYPTSSTILNTLLYLNGTNNQ